LFLSFSAALAITAFEDAHSTNTLGTNRAWRAVEHRELI
jgi:hypothetical protein